MRLQSPDKRPAVGRTFLSAPRARPQGSADRNVCSTEGRQECLPHQRQTPKRLRELQRLAVGVIMRELGPDMNTQTAWIDGRPMEEVAAEFIKPNDRLTSLERLEIYNKQYWFRVLDCLYDDYPGLRAILGEKKFFDLRVAYLTRYPSRSFTMRNLGGKLEQFIRDEPQWASPREAICIEMAQLEWAKVIAFDAEQKLAVSADDLLGKDPARLRLGLQPYLTLLEMNYPLDDFLLAVKKRSQNLLRSEASNAMEDHPEQSPKARVRLPRKHRVWVAVHRWENELYYKRLDERQFTLLTALRDGSTLGKACEIAFAGEANEGMAAKVSGWFKLWMELGWFCRREPAK